MAYVQIKLIFSTFEITLETIGSQNLSDLLMKVVKFSKKVPKSRFSKCLLKHIEPKLKFDIKK